MTKQQEMTKTEVVAYFFAVAIPPVGFLVGLALIAQGAHHGIGVVSVSLLVPLIVVIIATIFGVA